MIPFCRYRYHHHPNARPSITKPLIAGSPVALPQDPVVGSAMLEVGLPHPLLKEGVQVVMTPTVPHNRALNTSIEFLRALLPEVLPIIVYAISRDDLSDAVSVRFPYALLFGVEAREAVLCLCEGICYG